MRRRLEEIAPPTAIVIIGIVLALGGAARSGSDSGPGPGSSAWPHRSPEPTARVLPATPAPDRSSAPDQPALSPGPVSVDIEGNLSWALLERRTGTLTGAALTRTYTTQSMIKVWLVSDFLRRASVSGRDPAPRDLTAASAAIRDSDDTAAMRLYTAGGGDAVIERMIEICELADTVVYPSWWSRTEISARDAARLGGCVADGTAAGPQWTSWVLEQMTRVRGTTDPEDQPSGGRWGIVDGLPDGVADDDVAIKNGWTRIAEDDSWHVNCLAVTDDWSLAVLMRYPAQRSLAYGAQRCAAVTEQLVAAAEAAAPPEFELR